MFPAQAGVILIALISFAGLCDVPRTGGVILLLACFLRPVHNVPRTGGGDPMEEKTPSTVTVCSPHRRG